MWLTRHGMKSGTKKKTKLRPDGIMKHEKQETERLAEAGAHEDAAPVEVPEAGDAGVADTADVAAERDRLAKERADLYDQLLRRTAEFDNFRRRAQRERTEFAEYAGMEIARELLPVLDNFERALKVETADTDYAKGMGLIYTRLFETLRKFGLEPLEVTGRQFDPNLHHAVDKVTTEEVEDQTILEELQRGYNFKGRLLRPAMVKVAVRP
jgi:molecular chaperone GrpE